MAHKVSRTKSDREAPSDTTRPAWQLPQVAAPAAPPGRRARWLLAAAILLQLAWIAALVAMALFVRWKK